MSSRALAILVLSCAALLAVTWGLSALVIEAPGRETIEDVPDEIPPPPPPSIEVAQPAQISAPIDPPAPEVATQSVEPTAPPPPPVLASLPQPAPVLQSLPSEPAPAPVAETTVATDLDVLVDEAHARDERREERRQSLAELAAVERELSNGESEGASAVLLQAADRLGGERAAELREAAQRLDNEDLSAARELIGVVLLEGGK